MPSLHPHVTIIYITATTVTPGWELGWLIKLSVGGEIFLKLCVSPVCFSRRAEVHSSPEKAGDGLEFMLEGDCLLCSELWRAPLHPHLSGTSYIFLSRSLPPPFFLSPLLVLVDLEISEAHPTSLFWDASLYGLFKWGFKKAETLLSQEEKLSTLIWEGWWLKVVSSRGGDKTYTMSHIIQQEWECQIDSSAPELGISLTTLVFYLPGCFPPRGLTCLWALRGQVFCGELWSFVSRAKEGFLWWQLLLRAHSLKGHLSKSSWSEHVFW